MVIRGENDDELTDARRATPAASAPRSASSNTWTSAARRAGRPPGSCRATEILAAPRAAFGAPTPIGQPRRGAGVALRAAGRPDHRRHRVDDRAVLRRLRSRPADRRRPALHVPVRDARRRSPRPAARRRHRRRARDADPRHLAGARRIAAPRPVSPSKDRAVVHRPRRAEGASRTSKCTRAAADPRAAAEYAGHHRSRRSTAATCAPRGGPRAVHHRHRAWPGRARGARALLRPHGRPDPRPGRVGARRVAGQHGRRGARRLWAPGAVAALGRRSAARLRRRHRHGRRGVPQGRAPSALGPRPDRRPSGAHPRGSADDRSRQPHVPALAGRRAPARGQPRPLRVLRSPRPQPDRQGARAGHRGAAAADHRPLRHVQRHDLPARAGHQGGAGRPPRHRGGPPARLAGARSGGDRRGRPRTGRELPPARARHPPPGRAAQLQHPRPRAAGARRRAPALPRRRSDPARRSVDEPLLRPRAHGGAGARDGRGPGDAGSPGAAGAGRHEHRARRWRDPVHRCGARVDGTGLMAGRLRGGARARRDGRAGDARAHGQPRQPLRARRSAAVTGGAASFRCSCCGRGAGCTRPSARCTTAGCSSA